MLGQFLASAIVVTPIVWVFFHLYFAAKQEACRKHLLLGMLYGVAVTSIVAVLSLRLQ